MKSKSSNISLVSLLSEIKVVAPLIITVGEKYKIYHTDNMSNYNVYIFLEYDDKTNKYLTRLMDYRGKEYLSEPFEIDKDIIDAKASQDLIEKF